MRVIVFDRTAILFFERASDCTKILYFSELSMYFCTPRFGVCPDRIEQTSSKYSLAYTGFTSVKNTDCLSPLKLSSWDQSALNSRVHVVRVPDVRDVLGDVIRQQYIVLQCKSNKITSLMSLNHRYCSEESGFKQY